VSLNLGCQTNEARTTDMLGGMASACICFKRQYQSRVETAAVANRRHTDEIKMHMHMWPGYASSDARHRMRLGAPAPLEANVA
jgi:hypothetical protein